MEHLKSFWKGFRPALIITLILLLLCGLIFPLLLCGLSAVIFPHQAKGSLVELDGKAVGAEFVGQEFTEDYYLHCRPSAVHYNTYREDADGNKTYADGSAFGGLASGSNNYAPSNPALQERAEQDLQKFLAENPGVKAEDIPADLLTASGSGLDPHISPASAKVQLPRVAEASGLSPETLQKIVEDNTTGKLFGIFGEETVNVLGVNVEITKQMKAEEQRR